MLRAFLLSLRDLGDPRVLRVVAKSLIVTLTVFVALGIAVYAALDRWAGHALSAAAAIGAAILAGWLLFRVVAIAAVQLFGDQVVAAVEARHYPYAVEGERPLGVIRSLRMALGGALRAFVVNLAMLPVYGVLLFTAVGAPIAFFAVNGWLLGRDLGDTVASRYMGDAALKRWRAATGSRRFALGLLVTGMLSVPFVNLLAPILGAAMATHLFHGDRR